jgi:hypothetical protein
MTMSEKHYVPREIARLIAWLLNFADQLGKHGARLGLSPGEIAGGQTDARYLAAVLQMQQAALRFSKAWTTFKDEAFYGKDPLTAYPARFEMPADLPAVKGSGVMRRVTKLAGRLKTLPGYDDGLGELFGIVGVERVVTPADLAALKPVIRVKLVSAGHPIVIWKKKGLTGVDIEVDRGDGKGFVYLNFDEHPDYLDLSPLPAPGTSAIWTYRAIYRKGDDRVGQWSDEVKVTVTGTV